MLLNNPILIVLFQIEEDDPLSYKHAVAILTMKLFADLERKRRETENKISNEAAKTREAQLQAEERKTVEKEFAKNWEDSRQGRVNSWLNFTGKPVHNSKKDTTTSTPSPTAPPNSSPIGQGAVRDEGSNKSTGGYGGVRNTWNPQSNIKPTNASSYSNPNNSSVYGSANYGQTYQQSASNISAPVEKKPKKKKEKRFSPMGFRPPKHKPETRD